MLQVGSPSDPSFNLVTTVLTGLPSYSSDTYYDDYDEEEYDDDGEDGLDHEQENLEEMYRMAKILMSSTHTFVGTAESLSKWSAPQSILHFCLGSTR